MDAAYSAWYVKRVGIERRGKHSRDWKKTSMQMDRPLEFSPSSSTLRGRARVRACVRICASVFVNTGCAGTFPPTYSFTSACRGVFEETNRPSFQRETKLREIDRCAVVLRSFDHFFSFLYSLDIFSFCSFCFFFLILSRVPLYAEAIVEIRK